MVSKAVCQGNLPVPALAWADQRHDAQNLGQGSLLLPQPCCQLHIPVVTTECQAHRPEEGNGTQGSGHDQNAWQHQKSAGVEARLSFMLKTSPQTRDNQMWHHEDF